MPGAKALAWAVVGLAAFRKRKDQSAVHDATSIRSGPGRPARPIPPPTGRSPWPSRACTPLRPRTPPGRTRRGQPGPNGAPRPAERPGEQAEPPAQIPAKGWWQVIRRAFKESTGDNVCIFAGGVAYFGFLAVFPALIAAISLYGLVADPATVAAQINGLASALPGSAQPLVADQLNAVVSAGNSQLGFSLVVSVLAALWSASGGTTNLMKAINIAYDEEEGRGRSSCAHWPWP